MGKKIIIFIVCVFLAAPMSFCTTHHMWDGGYPSGVFELKLKNEKGDPIQGAKLDIFKSNSNTNAYGYPFDNYDQGARLVSDKDGIIKLYKYSGGIEFGGSGWLLFWIIPMGDKAPRFVCSINADRYGKLKFDAWDIFDEMKITNQEMVVDVKRTSVKQLTKPEYFTNALDMTFVKIEPSTFVMGSDIKALGRRNDEKQHRVTITKTFFMQTTEVTQKQWVKVMENDPSHFNCGYGDCPVENISWEDAQRFIKKLNQIKGNSKYRLPTEAEWEYACKVGGTRFTYSEKYAWYSSNSKESTRPVGLKEPNIWGLYDISGNVSEWCLDLYGEYPSGSVNDPEGAEYGEYQVYRGGSWQDSPKELRCSNREALKNGGRSPSIGFRLVRTP